MHFFVYESLRTTISVGYDVWGMMCEQRVHQSVSTPQRLSKDHTGVSTVSNGLTSIYKLHMFDSHNNPDGHKKS